MIPNQQLPQVLHRLILDQALATVDYTEEEREQFGQQLNQDGTYQAWLRQQGVTAAQFESWLTRELTIRKFQQQHWGKVLTSYFLERKHELDRVVCSLIYIKSKEIAQELYFRIVEGEQSFAEIARIYSQGQEAELGGRVGPVELGKLHPKLARMFYGGRPGQLWEPTVVEDWVIIARLDETLPVQLDELMQQTLLNELLEAWLQDQLEQRFPKR